MYRKMIDKVMQQPIEEKRQFIRDHVKWADSMTSYIDGEVINEVLITLKDDTILNEESEFFCEVLELLSEITDGQFP